jgi:hypothetical protein
MLPTIFLTKDNNSALMRQLKLKNTGHSTQSASEQLIKKKMKTPKCSNVKSVHME